MEFVDAIVLKLNAFRSDSWTSEISEFRFDFENVLMLFILFFFCFCCVSVENISSWKNWVITVYVYEVKKSITNMRSEWAKNKQKREKYYDLFTLNQIHAHKFGREKKSNEICLFFYSFISIEKQFPKFVVTVSFLGELWKKWHHCFSHHHLSFASNDV